MPEPAVNWNHSVVVVVTEPVAEMSPAPSVPRLWALPELVLDPEATMGVEAGW